MKWTKEDKETLRHMWLGEGKTMTQISSYFGVSRSAIAGKIGRLGLRKNLSLPKPPPKPKKPKLRPKTPAMVRKRKIVPLPPAVSTVVIPVANSGVKLLRRKEGQCAYLIGRQLCCGAPTIEKMGTYGPQRTSWCSEHYDIVYQRESKRRDRRQFKSRA